MRVSQHVTLQLNGEHQVHGDTIVKLLRQAEQLECMVAFAKESAWSKFLEPLRKALDRGMTARFAIGLSFHLTEPAALRKLFTLARRYNKMQLYLSNTSETFHPKIYAFREAKKCSVIVGSANLTYGGLCNNYEASLLANNESGKLMHSIVRHFDKLIKDEIIVLATKNLIDEYTLAFKLHDAWRKIAKKRAERAIRVETGDYSLLANILEEMRLNTSRHGFEAHKTLRKDDLAQAKQQIKKIAALGSHPGSGFLGHYEKLINLFHSGGLHRAKTRIAKHPHQFVAAVADIVGQRNLSPDQAFNILHVHFENITGAGINLLTEILHAQNNKRFAVMNQNAVTGLAMAGIRGYPDHPTKENVDADLYTEYCQHAKTVQQALGLANFTELDALFNYAYWQQDNEDADT